jgi:hypothetical protein
MLGGTPPIPGAVASLAHVSIARLNSKRCWRRRCAVEFLECEFIQELAPPEQPLIGFSEFGQFAGLRPSVTNSRDLVLDQLKRFSLVEQEGGAAARQVARRLRLSSPLMSMACVASLPVRFWGQISYAGVKDSSLPSEKAAWLRA